jgi:pyruvate/2-oxoglutarate dehydrogenase complex dihydrolipoamide dehydrogenase (E3) component
MKRFDEDNNRSKAIRMGWNNVASEHFDVAIIGAGQAGGPLASAFANGGKSTVIIERAHVGGTCVNEGCTPTKTMIASGDIAYRAKRGADFGVETGDISISMTKIRDRKRANVKIWREGSEKGLHDTEGVTLLMGEARFTGPKDIHVTMNDGGERQISADTIVVNAGERPGPLKASGAEAVPFLTSTSIMELDEVPGHLIVVGGGYVGLEFSQLFRRLGSDVTIIQHGKQLLSREDPDIAEEMRKVLEEDGLTIHLNSQTTSVSGTDGAIELTIAQNGRQEIITGTHLLAAAGRIPNTDSLDLDKAGVETDDHGYILTDDFLETNVPGVYAVGDVRPGPKFTHISYDDYRVLQTNLIDGGHRSIEGRQVPYVVFTEPQLGRIGLSEQDARKQGIAYRIASMPMSSVARAYEVDEPRGVMKVLVDPKTERILGAAIFGLDGGEIMAMLQIAMLGDLPFTKLRDGIWAHPTLAEGLNNLFFSFQDPS